MGQENGNLKYLPLIEVAKGISYSQEYLSLLVRKGKIPAKKIDGSWYTTKEAVQEYLKKQ